MVMRRRVPIRLGSIATRLKPSSSNLVSSSFSRVCRVCTQQEARYTCPRCNIPYCSVKCYQSHGDKCTETFYQAHVQDELQYCEASRKGSDDDEKKKIHELMTRYREFQEKQEENAMDEEEKGIERMQELVLLDQAGKLTLDSLTFEERKRFLEEVADGRLGKFLELWLPWWCMSEQKYCNETTARRRQLIMEEMEEIGNEKEEVRDPLILYPVGLFTNSEAHNMPKGISILLHGHTQPSPYLRYHLIEVLFAYARVLRAYNGDYEQDVVEAALMLLDLCQVLSVDARYGSVEHACVACLEKQSNDGPAANTLAIHDTQKLLQSHVFVLDALSDTRTVLERYAKELGRSHESTKQARKERKTALKKLTVVLKKLQFYTIWVYHTPIEEFQALAADIEAYVKDKELLGAQD